MQELVCCCGLAINSVLCAQLHFTPLDFLFRVCTTTPEKFNRWGSYVTISYKTVVTVLKLVLGLALI